MAVHTLIVFDCSDYCRVYMQSIHHGVGSGDHFVARNQRIAAFCFSFLEFYLFKGVIGFP